MIPKKVKSKISFGLVQTEYEACQKKGPQVDLRLMRRKHEHHASSDKAKEEHPPLNTILLPVKAPDW